MAIVGTCFGSPHHPAWYHNLLATPHADMERDGLKSAVVARSVPDGPEYDAVMHAADAVYSGFPDLPAPDHSAACSDIRAAALGLTFTQVCPTSRANRAGAWTQYESVSSSANSDQSVSSSRIIPTTLTPQPARK